jgi:hypothetical protein
MHMDNGSMAQTIMRARSVEEAIKRSDWQKTQTVKPQSRPNKRRWKNKDLKIPAAN